MVALLPLIGLAAIAGSSCNSPASSAADGPGETVDADARMNNLGSRFGQVIEPAAVAVSPSAKGVVLAEEQRLVDVELPTQLADGVHIADIHTGVGVTFSLEGTNPDARGRSSLTAPRPPAAKNRGASPAPEASQVTGTLYYPRGMIDSGGEERDVVAGIEPDAVEDFVSFETRPSVEEVTYHLHLDRAKALHSVRGYLEVIDESNAPRLRLTPPVSIDQNGNERAARVSVKGCTVDSDPTPTWSREVEPAGSTECDLVVNFAGATYPMVLDPKWQAAGNMALARTNHTATVLDDDTVLIVGGFGSDGKALAEAEIMCPLEKCKTGVTFTVPPAGLSVARGDHTASKIGTSVLLSGGRATRGAATSLNTAELCTTPDFTCTSFTMNTGRADHTATVLADSSVLVAGGDGLNPSTAQVFTAGAGFAAPIAMMEQRDASAAELIASTGQVLIAGGVTNFAPVHALSTAELFNPKDGTFVETTNSMTSLRANATATALENGRVLVAGGTNGFGVYFKTADVFIPDGNAASPNGSFASLFVNMEVPRAFHRATTLSGTGTVLITGGYNGNTNDPQNPAGVTAKTEIYDQGTNTFTLGTTMVRPRAFHTASLLQSGQPIVTGGGFDPGTNKFDALTAISTETLGRLNAEQCDENGECESGFCVKAGSGHICCDAECSDICSTCSADANGPVGTCHTAQDDTLVKSDCSQSVQFALKCVAGAVKATDVVLCSPFGCGNGLCNTSCKTDGDCATDGWCAPLVPPALTRQCEKKKTLGEDCTAGNQCSLGFCADGLCCNTACDEQCQACDVAGSPGACVQVTGDPHGTDVSSSPKRELCGGSGTTCGGTCGTKTASCDYGTDACGTPSCSDSNVTTGKCSGTAAATCITKTDSCGDYQCADDGSACKTTCTTQADCVDGRACTTDGHCKVVAVAQCDADGHTLILADGTKNDCAPLKCSDQACLNRCNSVDDCVSPDVCDDKGECIAAPANPSAPTGCSVAIGESSSPGWSLASGVVGVGLLFGARRSRKRKSERRGSSIQSESRGDA